jgi:hypothetical protein
MAFWRRFTLHRAILGLKPRMPIQCSAKRRLSLEGKPPPCTGPLAVKRLGEQVKHVMRRRHWWSPQMQSLQYRRQCRDNVSLSKGDERLV